LSNANFHKVVDLIGPHKRFLLPQLALISRKYIRSDRMAESTEDPLVLLRSSIASSSNPPVYQRRSVLVFRILKHASYYYSHSTDITSQRRFQSLDTATAAVHLPRKGFGKCRLYAKGRCGSRSWVPSGGYSGQKDRTRIPCGRGSPGRSSVDARE
jgi:hypothetical protein